MKFVIKIMSVYEYTYWEYVIINIGNYILIHFLFHFLSLRKQRKKEKNGLPKRAAKICKLAKELTFFLLHRKVEYRDIGLLSLILVA